MAFVDKLKIYSEKKNGFPTKRAAIIMLCYSIIIACHYFSIHFIIILLINTIIMIMYSFQSFINPSLYWKKDRHG